MGGKSTSDTVQKQEQTSAPWLKAQPSLDSILGGLNDIPQGLSGVENQALNTLSTNANAGNPWTSQFGNLATELFGGGTDRTGMVNDAYSQYQKLINPTASGDYLDPNKNPWFSQVTKTIGDDVTNRVNAMYSSAGRDPSGAGSYGQNLGKGIAEGVAPVFASAYNQERGNQLGAINNLFGAGNQTAGILSALDQTSLANKQAGMGAAGQAISAQNYGPQQLLAIEAQRRGIPLNILQALAGIVTPIAGLGGQSTGSSTGHGQAQMSGADQFFKIASGLGALFPKPPGAGSIPAPV